MQKPRFLALDGLRGIAALIVAMSHYVLAFQPGLMVGTLGPDPVHFSKSLAIAQTPLMLVYNPELGVALFFVLSGFVLAASVRHKPAPWPQLAVRRWLRLTLPILASSTLIWLWIETGLDVHRALGAQIHSTFLGGPEGLYWWVAVWPNLFTQMLYQSTIDVYAWHNHYQWNAVLWTMQIEFYGSLALFAAYAMLRHLRAPGGVRLALALLTMVLCWGLHYFSFAAGAALFEAYALGLAASGPIWVRMVWMRRVWVRNAAGCSVLLAGAVLGGTPMFQPLPSLYWRLDSVFMHIETHPVLDMHRVGAVLITAAIIIMPAAQRLLGARVFQFLGRISFLAYLLHLLVLCSIVAYVVEALLPLLGYNLATAAALPVFFAVLLPLAAWATAWIDQPAIALSRRAAGWVRMPNRARQ